MRTRAKANYFYLKTSNLSWIITRLSLPLIFFLAGCSPATAILPAAPSRPFPKVESLEEIPCPFDLPYDNEVTCGKLVVPEDYNNPTGDQVSLTVARVHSTGTNLAADPVIVLGGDPGFVNLQFLRYFIEAPMYVALLQERELVFYDWRGMDYSTPSLACPDFSEANYQLIGQKLNRSARIQAYTQIMQDCRQKLVDEGAHLQFYTTDENVADLHALILGLGVDQVNLLGLGYGADLALRLVQFYPEKVRSVLASSPYSPASINQDQAENLQRSLDLMFQRCAEDKECSQAFPNLENDFFALVEDLNNNPVTIDLTRRSSNETMPMVVDGDEFLYLARGMLSNQNLLPELPKLILDVKEGRTYHLATPLENNVQSIEFMEVGVVESVFCQAYLSGNELPQPSTQVHETLRQWQQHNPDYDREVCADWFAVKPAPFSTPKYSSGVPTLLVNGEYNAYTSSSSIQEMEKSLGSGKFVEMEQSGWINWSEPCAMDLGLAFIKTPTSGLDTSCTEEISPVEFILPLK